MQGQVVQTLVPLTFVYKNRVGQYLENYLEGLKEKKILGVQCKKCKRIIVPPRATCGTCFESMDKIIEVPQVGVLKNFTIGYVNIENGDIKETQSPYIIGAVKLDRVYSLLTGLLKGVDPNEVKIGMRVKAVWKEVPEGNYSDLVGFEPVPSKVKKPKKKVKQAKLSKRRRVKK